MGDSLDFLSTDKLESEMKRRGIPFVKFQNNNYYADLHLSRNPASHSDALCLPHTKVRSKFIANALSRCFRWFMLLLGMQFV